MSSWINGGSITSRGSRRTRPSVTGRRAGPPRGWPPDCDGGVPLGVVSQRRRRVAGGQVIRWPDLIRRHDVTVEAGSCSLSTRSSGCSIGRLRHFQPRTGSKRAPSSVGNSASWPALSGPPRTGRPSVSTAPPTFRDGAARAGSSGVRPSAQRMAMRMSTPMHLSATPNRHLLRREKRNPSRRRGLAKQADTSAEREDIAPRPTRNPELLHRPSDRACEGCPATAVHDVLNSDTPSDTAPPRDPCR